MEMNTPRLRLDALHPADAAALFGYRADPDVSRFQGWRPTSVAEAAGFIERQAGATLDTPDNWFQRAIRLHEDESLIGDLGIHLPGGVGGSIEFGISIAPAHQGNGYASEAVRAVFDLVFGRLGRHRTHASVDPRNLASMAMLRGLGMRQEAHHRESLWLQGEWVDDVIFAMLGREWLAQQAAERHRG
ncbi:N-acetyltransferase [Rhodanobacter glycinis]|uniref:N-acetyltransferase n=1 Tax=Rhodanobacter glycinis TaxID=582702 RepID=A0A502CAW8_9GAMM|nr:GNAT family protein [Rhodanobacter glycinis]TPG10327.1 N-acetyltransferase [Rhodanobacter glycinis]TPG51475.1 N-acetyltransferase [Rhodanobacter glycinis]